MLYLSFNLFYLVQTHVYSCEKLRCPEKKIETCTFGSIFPTTPRQRSNPHPREGLTKSPHPPRVLKMFKYLGFAWTFDLISALGEDGRKMLYYYITSCSKNSRRGQKAWRRTNLFWLHKGKPRENILTYKRIPFFILETKDHSTNSWETRAHF